MDTVNEQATFQQDDVFHRADFAKKAMALIKSHPANRGACVISIDAPWGMGKSTFLRMWMNELIGNHSQDSSQKAIFESIPNMCIYYNAWENDYYENAFIPLLFSICGSLLTEKDEKEGREQKKRDLLRKVTSAGAGILSFFACASSTNNPELSTAIGGMTTTAVNSFMKMFDDSDLDAIGHHYEKDLQTRNEFRRAVADLAQVAGRLFIFVDELDRCKPLFAVHTLECIKHFFNIPNVIFVFATDISQLAHSVSGIYGQGINAGGYLSKFFDYQLHLPAPNIYDLMRYSYPRISIDREYYGLLNEVVNAIGLTPRELPLIVDQVNTIWNAFGLNAEGFYASYIVPYLILLVGMKYRLPDLYHSFFAGSLSWQNQVNKESHRNVYDMLNYTFINLQIDKEKEAEVERWIQIYETALKTKKPRNSIDFNLPYLFAHFSRCTVNELRTLREVLLLVFDVTSVY